jgi:hypothetical protein
MRCQGTFLAVAMFILPAFSQRQADLPLPVYGYPATIDANRVYSPGDRVKVDEPHGVYTGVILMDDYYFLQPLTIIKSVRRAISPTRETLTFAFVCENRDLKVGQNELARIPDGKEFVVGSHDSVCSLKHASVNAVPTAAEEAHVLVEPWQTLVRSTVEVIAGKAVQYNFPLVSGTTLSAQFQVQGGLNDKIQVLLLDADNFQLYSAHRPFKHYPGSPGVIRAIGKYNFKIPHDGVYYIVVDNGRAWLMPRNVTLHLDAILPQSTPTSEQIRAALETQYSTLKRVFIFSDFQTSVAHCGVVNAFSNPNITICVELLEELQASGMAETINFVYLHELGHTLMREWGLPLWDNEDAADEFATAFLLMGKQQKIALQAAQWWASQSTSTQDAVAKIWMDDRHSLSPQRARNIIRWVNNESEIVPRWERVFVPNMQTELLESMLRDPAVSDKDSVKSELGHRTTSR